MPKGRYDDHAAAHAAGRRSRPRHDAAHLHHPDQPRLFERSGHGGRSSAPASRCSRSPPRCSPTRRSPKASPTASSRYRSHIWSDTDPHRTGMLPFVFEDGFGYERYVDYMLDVPMYFVFRDGKYIDAAGQSFRDFLQGKLPALPGELPTRERLDRPPLDRLPRSAAQELPRNARRRRRPVEPHLRAARAVGRPALRPAPRSTPRGIWSRTGRWKSARRLRNAVPKLALDAPIPGGRKLLSLAREVLPIARAGLVAPRQAQRQRRQRDRLPRTARRDRRFGQGPGAAPARQVQRRMGRRHRPGLRREFLGPIPPVAFAARGAPGRGRAGGRAAR